MGEPATTLLDRWGPEDDPTPEGAPGRRRFVVAALVLALPATLAATAFMVFSRPDLGPPAPSGPSASAPVAPDPRSTTLPPLPFPTDGYAGATVADAVAGLEAAGAEVEVYDARVWERTVAPDWRVCTAGELYFGDTPSGIVQIAAVPAGDPCP
jgi:hypothetical protein